MFLVLLVFVGLVRHSELTSAGIPESSSLTSASPAARKRSQDIGSLNDFSWQAWVMVEQAGAQPGADSSATLLRRIMPKSIFIAPQLQACSDGYVADEMNRCVKNVDIDEIAHFSFLLHRLNNMYGNSKTNPPSNGQSNGPLQLNIPLMADSESKKVEMMDTLSANDPLAVVVDQIGLADDKKIKHEASTAAAHEVKNDTATDDDDKATKGQVKKDVEETTFFPENPRPDNQVDKSERKPDAVPVAEFVEETNEPSFSEVVNYKIPADLKTLPNASNFAKGSNASDGAPTTDKRVSVTEIPPLVQLLLSSTMAPSTASDADSLLSSAKNSTVDRASSNHSSPAKETDNASDFYEPPPAWKASDERRENETRAEDEPPRTSETHETDFIYDEEVEDDEYAYSTDVPDEESTEAEGEEILKHGEAGMTIPTRSPGRLHHKQTADRKKTTGPRDQVRYNDTAEKDEAGSNISSEVSIDGDLILETTLLDVNTERLQVTTQSSDATTAGEEGGSYDHRTEVVPPPKDTDDIGAQNHNRAEQTTQNERRDEALEAVLSPLGSYDPPEEVQVPTGIRTIDEERPDVSSVFSDSKDDLNTTPRNTRSEGFVRFDESGPTDPDVGDYFPARQSQQQGYVRFPSNEANSIHSLNHKHQSSRETPSSDGGAYGGSSTKSSVPVRQKPVYQLTPSWKPDRQQDERAATVAGQRQKPPVSLLRLWSKMPPIREPIFPVDRFPTNRSEDDDDDSLEGGQQPPPGRHLRWSSSPTRRSSQRRVDKARERRRTPISG